MYLTLQGEPVVRQRRSAEDRRNRVLPARKIIFTLDAVNFSRRRKLRTKTTSHGEK